ncbi:hypothetical protein XI04_04385 [Bradyrhizobium sp. CCBAU 11430]|nr:hypothetical protein [Bradyrhizobium sp. CCBAU 25360]MDA9512303.1 hypothetical protein [Bradyrhizobium sp. CCBAU 11430]
MIACLPWGTRRRPQGEPLTPILVMIEQAFSALAWNIFLPPFLNEYMPPVAFQRGSRCIKHVSRLLILR